MIFSLLIKPLYSDVSHFHHFRYGVFEDPFGVIWSVSDTTNQIEDIPKELESKIMPYAMVTDATGYLQFLQDVFGATPSMEPMKQSNGKVRVNPGEL